MSFVFMLFDLSDPLMEPCQLLLLWERVDQGAKTMKGVLRIPQISKIGAMAFDGLVSYPRNTLGRYLSYLQRCSRYFLHPKPTELDFLRET